MKCSKNTTTNTSTGHAQEFTQGEGEEEGVEVGWALLLVLLLHKYCQQQQQELCSRRGRQQQSEWDSDTRQRGKGGSSSFCPWAWLSFFVAHVFHNFVRISAKNLLTHLSRAAFFYTFLLVQRIRRSGTSTRGFHIVYYPPSPSRYTLSYSVPRATFTRCMQQVQYDNKGSVDCFSINQMRAETEVQKGQCRSL